MLKLQDEVRLCVAFLRIFCASYLFCLLHCDYVFNFLSSIGINYSYNDCYESMINDRYQQTDNWEYLVVPLFSICYAESLRIYILICWIKLFFWLACKISFIRVLTYVCLQRQRRPQVKQIEVHRASKNLLARSQGSGPQLSQPQLITQDAVTHSSPNHRTRTRLTRAKNVDVAHAWPMPMHAHDAAHRGSKGNATTVSTLP